MRLKNILSATFAVLLSTMLLSTNAVQAGESLDRVMKNNTLVVATDPSWPPQSFLNDQNEMDGFDVDVAREIAKRIGVGIDFVTPQWSVITAGNWYGRWDISVGSMTPTKDRAKVLSFPAVYYFTPASFVVHKDAPYKDKKELNGKRIGASTATTFENYLKKDLVMDVGEIPSYEYDVSTDDIASYENSTAALDDLRLGDGVRIDAIIGALPAHQEAIKANYPIRVIGTPAFYEPLSLAIDRGDEEFNNKLAEIIKAMQDDDTLSNLSIKWYGIDYTKTVK